MIIENDYQYQLKNIPHIQVVLLDWSFSTIPFYMPVKTNVRNDVSIKSSRPLTLEVCCFECHCNEKIFIASGTYTWAKPQVLPFVKLNKA